MDGWRIGAAWILGGMALIAVSDNFVALIARDIGLWQFHALRSGLVVPLVLALAWATGRLGALRPRAWGRVVQRSLFGVAALMCYFGALPAVGIAQAGAGLFTAPIWVMGFAALLGGERVRPAQIAAALIGFAGVCLVLGVGAAPPDPMGVVAVAGGAFWGLSVVWTRAHCRGETAAALALAQFVWLGVAGALGLVLLPMTGGTLAMLDPSGFLSRGWATPGPGLVALVVGTGVAGLIATGCLARGYQAGASSLMGLFDFSFLVWAPLVAWGLWGTAPTLGTLAGMALIVAAGALAIRAQSAPHS